MSLLKKKKLNVTAPNPTFKVKYLGNVATTMVQGDDCTSRPVKLLWDNHLKTSGSLCVPMTISVDNSGLSVRTETRGSRHGADKSESMHYWCHRISTFTSVKEHHGLFVWVYRHAGKNMKVDLRCHAILCKNEKVSCELNDLVAKVLRSSLSEYVREKQQNQRRRSLQEKVAGFFTRSKPLRKQLLSPGKNYKPPIEYYYPPPQLDVIKEDRESCTSDEADDGVVMKSSGSRLAVSEDEQVSSSSRSNPTLGISMWQPRQATQPRLCTLAASCEDPLSYSQVLSAPQPGALRIGESVIPDPVRTNGSTFLVEDRGKLSPLQGRRTFLAPLLTQETQLQSSAGATPVSSSDTPTFHGADLLPGLSVALVSYDEVSTECNFQPSGPAPSSHDVTGLVHLVNASHLSDVHYL